MKHANTGTSYTKLTKRVKVQHEKNLYRKCRLQIVGFEQTSKKFTEIFIL